MDFARIRTFDDYRKAVPIRDYAGLEPWIARAAVGESNVLTAEDPVLFFMSSGTTGDSKKIPVTRSFMRQTFFPFYFAMWAGLVDSFPETLLRNDATYNLKFDPRKAITHARPAARIWASVRSISRACSASA